LGDVDYGCIEGHATKPTPRYAASPHGVGLRVACLLGHMFFAYGLGKQIHPWAIDHCYWPFQSNASVEKPTEP